MASLTEIWRTKGDIDIALLRSFMAVVDLGGVARAAAHIGRSQPATSLQIKRLQEDLGVALFRKTGRHLELTDAGEKLVPLARRLVGLHDQALAAMTGDRLSGRVRIGIVEDFAEDWLTGLLSQFSAIHPSVSVEVRSDRRAALLDHFRAGDLDLLLTFGESAPAEAVDIGTIPICWIGSEIADWAEADCLPLVLLDGACLFRDLALAACESSGRRYRIAFTSHAVSTQWAAVRAGMGISLRTPIGLKRPLRALEPAGALPPLAAPALHLLLYSGGRAENRPAEHLKALLLDSMREQMRTAA